MRPFPYTSLGKRYFSSFTGCIEHVPLAEIANSMHEGGTIAIQVPQAHRDRNAERNVFTRTQKSRQSIGLNSAPRKKPPPRSISSPSVSPALGLNLSKFPLPAFQTGRRSFLGMPKSHRSDSQFRLALSQPLVSLALATRPFPNSRRSSSFRLSLECTPRPRWQPPNSRRSSSFRLRPDCTPHPRSQPPHSRRSSSFRLRPDCTPRPRPHSPVSRRSSNFRLRSECIPRPRPHSPVSRRSSNFRLRSECIPRPRPHSPVSRRSSNFRLRSECTPHPRPLPPVSRRSSTFPPRRKAQHTLSSRNCRAVAVSLASSTRGHRDRIRSINGLCSSSLASAFELVYVKALNRTCACACGLSAVCQT